MDKVKCKRFGKLWQYFGKKDTQLSLLNLPEEIFLYICSFLDKSTLVHNLSLVCKQFYHILNSDSVWKARIRKIWPNVTYPILDTANTTLWKSSYLDIRKRITMCLRMKAYHMSGPSTKPMKSQAVSLFEISDTVILIYAVCDNLKMIYESRHNFEREYNTTKCNVIFSITQNHHKTICDLTRISDTIFSCDSESTIISWKITHTNLKKDKTYKVKTSSSQTTCLSSCSEKSLFAIGTHSDGSVYVFDSRSGSKPIWNYQTDTKGVNKLVMNTKYILSAGENHTVSVWDQRAGQIFKCVAIRGIPTCMNLQQNCVYVGDNKGRLHILDPNNDFELVKSYFTGHKDRMIGVYLSQSCLITGSRDGLIKVMSATDPPLDIFKVQSSYRNDEMNSMDYIPDVFAIGRDDNAELILLRDRSFDYLSDSDDDFFGDNFFDDHVSTILIPRTCLSSCITYNNRYSNFGHFSRTYNRRRRLLRNELATDCRFMSNYM